MNDTVTYRIRRRALRLLFEPSEGIVEGFGLTVKIDVLFYYGLMIARGYVEKPIGSADTLDGAIVAQMFGHYDIISSADAIQ
jgi:hypothetical protein